MEVTVILDSVVLSISVAFLAIYISVKVSVITSVGNLNRIRSYSILQILKEHESKNILEILELLDKEANVLLYTPNEKNNTLFYSFLFFLICALITSFTPYIITIIDIKDVVLYSVFSFSVAIVSFFLWYEFKYYSKYKELEKRYPIPTNFDVKSVESILVMID